MVLATLAVGLLAGRTIWGDIPTDSAVSRGVIDSVDPSSASVCVGTRGEVECFLAPGLGLSVGQQVRFTTEAQPIDPADPSKGTQDTIIWVSGDN